MIISVGKVRVVLKNPGDRVVVHSKKPEGWERESLMMWKNIVKPGTIALDVGAYTGIYSLVAAKVGATAVAIEPLPANVKRLRYNAMKNKANVRIIEAAASAGDGVSTLGYNPRIPLTSGASLEGTSLFGETMLVSTITVDALALTGISAIKIDVEKHEPAVIVGASRTIARERPALMIETLDNEMRTRVADLLPAYKVAAVLDGRNTLFIPR